MLFMQKKMVKKIEALFQEIDNQVETDPFVEIHALFFNQQTCEFLASGRFRGFWKNCNSNNG